EDSAHFIVRRQVHRFFLSISVVPHFLQVFRRINRYTLSYLQSEAAGKLDSDQQASIAHIKGSRDEIGGEGAELPLKLRIQPAQPRRADLGLTGIGLGLEEHLA